MTKRVYQITESKNYTPEDLINAANGIPTTSGNSKTLVGNDTDSLLGSSPVKRYASEVFKKLDGDASSYKNLHFPLDLGTEDSQHILLLKIYNGHSEQYKKQEREIQELENIQALIDHINNEPDIGVRKRLTAQYDYLGISGNEYSTREQTTVGFFGKFSIPTGQYKTTTHFEAVPPRNIATEIETLKDKLHKVKQQESRTRRNPNGVTVNAKDRLRSAEIRQKETIALYLPHKLNVAGLNTYDTPEFGLVKDIKGMLTGDSLAAFEGTFIRRGAGFADSAVEILGGELNAKRAVAAVTGKVMNPRRETLFVSPELRKFEFTFEFAPRNEKESIALKEIIKTLKYHAYPAKSGDGYFFDMPAEFEIQYWSIINGTGYENAWMNKIARCVLQEVNVDYTASGSVSMFHNAAPTNINLTLSFQEVVLLTQQDIEDGF